MSQELTPISQKEDWVNRKWRPAMAWTYMAICIFDFMLAPILNYIFFSKIGGDFISWKPLTMTEGGLFHIAMGAILGITAWKRGEEKIERIKNSYEDYDEPGQERATYRDRLSRNAPRKD